MVGQVERVELRRRAKFGQNGQASAEMCRFLDFFNMVAVRYLGFVVRVLRPHMKGIWWFLSRCKIWLESIGQFR